MQQEVMRNILYLKEMLKRNKSVLEDHGRTYIRKQAECAQLTETYRRLDGELKGWKTKNAELRQKVNYLVQAPLPL
jgi:hypothetical protein